ncbi:uncharacterized methyltransferase-like C25B8.10 [Mizuhopecten yessoensis]|uniref:uncharacterized methyltransferase-like C25B8.10 n=1 Tax=Mizuhopecten yessoensis TaxID=6573 RepID=UPI000B45754F|nr:uncharacterized methyltransferase-like C25B8.10 [Mizuhopecten yessoensis]
MSSTSVHAKTKTGFINGKNYDQSRPSYTEEAVSYIADLVTGGKIPGPSTGNVSYDIVELGAGTGKFTQKVMSKLTQDVKYLATEPMEGFLDTLKQLCPSVSTKLCAASDLPLPDNSVRTVVAAQCFHWFASEDSLKEICRVLVPGGRFVMVWNNKDWDEPWVKDIEDILSGYYGDTPRAINRTWKTVIEKFSGLSCKEHFFQAGIDFQGDKDFVVGHFSTISVIASLPEDEKEDIQRRMYQVLNSHDQTREKDIIRIPFKTEIYHSVKV